MTGGLHAEWVQIAADLTRYGCDRKIAEEIARDAASHAHPEFRLRMLRDDYRDAAMIAHKVADAIGSVMHCFPPRPFDRPFVTGEGDEHKTS